jgi:hypothetical protein
MGVIAWIVLGPGAGLAGAAVLLLAYHLVTSRSAGRSRSSGRGRSRRWAHR